MLNSMAGQTTLTAAFIDDVFSLILLKDDNESEHTPLSPVLVHQTLVHQCCTRGPYFLRPDTGASSTASFQPGDRVIPQGALVYRFPRLCTVIAVGEFVVGGHVRVAFDSPVVEGGKTYVGLAASLNDFTMVYRPGEEPDASRIEEFTDFVGRLKNEHLGLVGSR